jgi:type IV pilus assembly protein PilA
MNKFKSNEDKMKEQQGFTLIELMIVIAIIGILAAIAIPNFKAFRQRAYYCEAYELADDVRKNIKSYYEHRGVFPLDNKAAGVAAPEMIKGKYVDSVRVAHGNIHIQFGQHMIQKIDRMTMVLQPAIIRENPTGPIIWFWKDKSKDIPDGLELVVETSDTNLSTDRVQ